MPKRIPTIIIALFLSAFSARADLVTIWAGTDGGGDFNSSTNGTGAPDGSYADGVNRDNHTYSNYASADLGQIDSVVLVTYIYVSTSQSNDNATITPSNTGTAVTVSTAIWNSHVGSGNAGYEYFDITSDNAGWDFATDFIAGTQNAISIVKNQGADGGSFYFDAVGFQVFYTPTAPVGSIDSVSQTSTDGTGQVTLQYDLSDVDLDVCKLTIEYSYDNAIWYQAFIQSASTGTVNNTGVSGGTSTGQITAIATDVTDATFIWDTDNASNENGAFTGEDAAVYLRITPNDGGQDDSEQ